MEEDLFSAREFEFFFSGWMELVELLFKFKIEFCLEFEEL